MPNDLLETGYKIIHPDPSVDIESKSVYWPKEPDYEQISNLVTPLLQQYSESLGETRKVHMEHVFVFWEGQYTDMFVDDEGCAFGRSLPVNERATEIYLNNMKVNNPPAYQRVIEDSNSTKIHGLAILFSRRIWY